MDWINQVGGLLQKYVGAQAEQAPPGIDDDFDQVTQAAPRGALAEGVAAAFRSDQTAPFSQMVSQLFSQSNGTQRATILNTLVSLVGPSLVSQFLSRGGLSSLGGLLDNQGTITAEQAQQVSPQAVEQMAAQAEQKDPSIIDRFSDFYADHPTLVKTLGAAALTIALSKIAERQQGR
jgi:hypothetical protein